MKFLMHMNKAVTLFLIGAAAYAGIEVLWRGHTHWTMAVLGGILFLLLGGINEVLSWEMPLAAQCCIGAAIVTAAEFVAGLILNVWLGLAIWDYSDVPGNLMGQVCPQFISAWLGLSLVAIILDDWLRHWFWGEDRPRYTIFRKKKST